MSIHLLNVQESTEALKMTTKSASCLWQLLFCCILTLKKNPLQIGWDEKGKGWDWVSSSCDTHLRTLTHIHAHRRFVLSGLHSLKTLWSSATAQLQNKAGNWQQSGTYKPNSARFRRSKGGGLGPGLWTYSRLAPHSLCLKLIWKHSVSMSKAWPSTEGLFFPSKAPSSDHKRGLMTFKHTRTHAHTQHALTHTTLNLKTQKGLWWGGGSTYVTKSACFSEEAGEVMNEPFITGGCGWGGGASSLVVFPLRHKHSPGCLIAVPL